MDHQKAKNPDRYREPAVVDQVPPAAPAADDLAGRLLAERYRLRRLIATGGMAQVWEADDEVLSRPVAVKLLHARLAADSSFVSRFRAEAIAAARLAHPAIVSIYDTCNDDGHEAIVMELVRGTTLRRLLDERHALDPGEATAIAVQVADAHEAAHRAGLVHRDVKPANILLSDDGRVLVADFGIAKASAGADLTQDGMMIGTAKYLAPEQVEGKPVDARTDVYALGIVLYESLCGRPPFQADTDAATALARLNQEPLRPRQMRGGSRRRWSTWCCRPWPGDPRTASRLPATSAPPCSSRWTSPMSPPCRRASSRRRTSRHRRVHRLPPTSRTLAPRSCSPSAAGWCRPC